MIGDIANLALTFLLVLWLIGPPRLLVLAIILYLPPGAEAVRLITERVPLTFSALWQLLPHRRFAQMLHARKYDRVIWHWTAQIFGRYMRYYALGNVERGHHETLIGHRGST